jgi:hypothetical protein
MLDDQKRALLRTAYLNGSNGMSGKDFEEWMNEAIDE